MIRRKSLTFSNRTPCSTAAAVDDAAIDRGRSVGDGVVEMVSGRRPKVLRLREQIKKERY